MKGNQATLQLTRMCSDFTVRCLGLWCFATQINAMPTEVFYGMMTIVRAIALQHRAVDPSIGLQLFTQHHITVHKATKEKPISSEQCKSRSELCLTCQFLPMARCVVMCQFVFNLYNYSSRK